MRAERGQASVEWIGLLLLVSLALAALTQLAPRADGHTLASAVLRPVSCAADGRCAPAERSRRERAAPARRDPPAQAGVPFLLPAPRTVDPGRLRRLVQRPVVPKELIGRARRGALRTWQRAWLACLVYERIRYDLLHPESRIPGHRIPGDEILRMLNDCMSPVDLIRDWPLLTGE